MFADSCFKVELSKRIADCYFSVELATVIADFSFSFENDITASLQRNPQHLSPVRSLGVLGMRCYTSTRPRPGRICHTSTTSPGHAAWLERIVTVNIWCVRVVVEIGWVPDEGSSDILLVKSRFGGRGI